MEAAVQTVYYIILVPMVYAAFAICLLGTIARLVRIFREPKNPTTLQIFPEKRPKWLLALSDAFLMPTVRREKPLFWLFLMLFHISFLLLILGHLELLGKFSILRVVPHEVFLGKGSVGLILSFCLLFFLFRRFRSPYRELSVPEDYYLLILLFLAVLFGSQMHWARRWYEYGGMAIEDYQAYLLSLLHLKPKLSSEITTSGHSLMLLLHVFFANLFLMFFPFSQLMHSFFSLPMNKLRRG
jgi:nitrate reductase gamma subunit